MMLKDHLYQIFFPPRCVLCEKPLLEEENDLCRSCRSDTEEFTKAKRKISFVAGWTALWYYSGKVRYSLLRYKFHNHRNHGHTYAKLLAMRLLSQPIGEFDLITWVPVSRQRRWQRGFDQSQLIAQRMGQELNMPALPLLVKTRHTKPQSRLSEPAHRRANILNAYAPCDPQAIVGKRILLVDDIITTGATASECARVLLVAGAKQVYCAAVAAPSDKTKKRR